MPGFGHGVGQRRDSGGKFTGINDGGFAVNAGDVRHVPKQLRKELGLLDISEPTPEETTTAASVRVGPDGRFEFDGQISESMRLVLEDIERAKGLPPRRG